LFSSSRQKQTPVTKRKDNKNVTVVDYGPEICNRAKYEHDEAFLIENNSTKITSFFIRHKLSPSGNASRLTPQMGLGLCLALKNDSPLEFANLCFIIVASIMSRFYHFHQSRTVQPVLRSYPRVLSSSFNCNDCVEVFFCGLCHVSKCLIAKSGWQHTA